MGCVQGEIQREKLLTKLSVKNSVREEDCIMEYNKHNNYTARKLCGKRRINEKGDDFGRQLKREFSWNLSGKWVKRRHQKTWSIFWFTFRSFSCNEGMM